MLVFNDTRVIKARFFGQKDTGGKVEVLLERIVDATHAIAQVRSSKSPKPASRLRLAGALEVVVSGRAGASDEFFALETVDRSTDLWQLADAYVVRIETRQTGSKVKQSFRCPVWGEGDRLVLADRVSWPQRQQADADGKQSLSQWQLRGASLTGKSRPSAATGLSAPNRPFISVVAPKRRLA